MKVVFLHPDLGIGGAERLVVDAAIALKSKGHSVKFVTAHHDPTHAFAETTDGSLEVICVGDWLPRSIFGIFHALCAYIRMIYAAFFLVYRTDMAPDIIFCDQISACIPILKRKNAKVVYYCHFPDQLLTDRENWLKKLYRGPLDWLEEKTTGMADVILVNSKYTAGIFRKTFTTLMDCKLEVLYPSLNFANYDNIPSGSIDDVIRKNANKIFLSINRYERKKNLNLAIYAFEQLLQELPSDQVRRVHLIIAGGYDDRVTENIEYYQELEELAQNLEVSDYITFLKSPSDTEKLLLIHGCTAVLYTPDNEHFGIVPLEAMYMSRPVIAVNSGGPLETIIDDETGFLCEPQPDKFSEAMKKFVENQNLYLKMGKKGNEHVKQKFSFYLFTEQLHKTIENLKEAPQTKK
ncbi:alpha-1,3/1,6-mannosyltransferase ALG2-like [Centruroides sculpturatus]|uniref:alpha-1,3/1,6-mannosyltransferase ALG2-like n=2 Tax=Centruroides sculpturatus TaxID=218467 RepID=UPI000C6ECCDE|nr:alpha-1,3/1,6-mannosyltransferase ALG2-like [Centruroides sculpturatus]XP_023215526.1 alpha-1,3/1,6-mannosyltransferase ALG2-like [Centruroides sculpturatus]